MRNQYWHFRVYCSVKTLRAHILSHFASFHCPCGEEGGFHLTADSVSSHQNEMKRQYAGNDEVMRKHGFSNPHSKSAKIIVVESFKKECVDWFLQWSRSNNSHIDETTYRTRLASKSQSFRSSVGHLLYSSNSDGRVRSLPPVSLIDHESKTLSLIHI